MSTRNRNSYFRKWRQKNKDKVRKASNRWRKSHPRRATHVQINSRFGITIGEYETMLSAQSGVCAVCLNPPKNIRLHIDHCHRTGRIRGLLCFRCNVTIGKIERKFGNLRTPEMLLKVREYLLRPIPLGLEGEK